MVLAIAAYLPMPASCGFYAAHPEAIATGCQTSLSAIEASDDYLKFFFDENGKRDLNGDNKVSFIEAHWYASSRLENHNISYTDADALVDNYFDKNPTQLPTSISLKKLKQLSHHLLPEEQYALTKLTADLDSQQQIKLNTHIAEHQAAIKLLKDKTELSSAERNKLTALAYPLNLTMLARKTLYIEQTGNNATKDTRQHALCENIGIDEFIRS